MSSPFRTHVDVPVTGGNLRVAVSGPLSGKPMVVAAHGITASHVSWQPIARHLGDDVTFLALDLRGRGESASLPAPYGIDAHVADLVAVMDHVGAVRATLVGHSMGGYVVARTAAVHPDRALAVVLVDGGVPLPVPEGVEPDDFVDAVLGPAVARLRQTFPSREAYRDFWRAHPALADGWSEDVEAYVDYDLVGEEPELRSRVREEAVRADSRDLLLNPAVGEALLSLACPGVLLRAPRGLLNETPPLLPDELVSRFVGEVPGLVDEVIPDTNHYLIGLGDREAKTVADHIRRAAGVS